MGGRLAPSGGASGVRRPHSPGCPSFAQVVGARCPHTVGAAVQVWGPGTGSLSRMSCWGLRVGRVLWEIFFFT